MVTIDLSNLPKYYLEIIEKRSKFVHTEYNQILESIYRINNSNRNWYFSTVASRNPAHTILIRRLTQIDLIGIITRENNYKKLLINDFTLYKAAKFLFKSSKCVFVFSGRKKNTFRIFYFLSKMCFLQLIKIFNIYMLTRIQKKNKNVNNEINLVETFITNKSSLNHDTTYSDRYFGVFNHYKTLVPKPIKIIPTVLLDKDYKRNYSNLRKSHESFLIKESFLNLTDFLKIVLLPFTPINLPTIKYYFKIITLRHLYSKS